MSADSVKTFATRQHRSAQALQKRRVAGVEAVCHVIVSVLLHNDARGIVLENLDAQVVSMISCTAL